jgi:hypothetical protein
MQLFKIRIHTLTLSQKTPGGQCAPTSPRPRSSRTVVLARKNANIPKIIRAQNGAGWNKGISLPSHSPPRLSAAVEALFSQSYLYYSKTLAKNRKRAKVRVLKQIPNNK